MSKEQNSLMDKIVSLSKQRGFIFQSSEIYGGLKSAYDYGPLGVELKRNIMNEWWLSMVHEREDVTGIDASPRNIEVAKIHAKKNNLKIKYLATSPEKKIIQDKFDVILNLEVIEHVENVDLFMMAATDLLKKNGIMFIATQVAILTHQQRWWC